MYHAIVRARVRRLWQRAGNGDYQAAVALASPQLHFRFAGEPPLGADLHGPEEFGRWFAGLFSLLPGLRLTLTDLVVRGWPWNTTVVARLSITATLADGTSYANDGIQWVRLRWGRMVDDYVLEDTARLAAAVRRQHAAVDPSVSRLAPTARRRSPDTVGTCSRSIPSGVRSPANSASVHRSSAPRATTGLAGTSAPALATPRSRTGPSPERTSH